LRNKVHVKRFLRAGFYLFCGLCWLCALLLIAEFALRVLSSRALEQALVMPVVSEAKARDRAAIAASAALLHARPAFANPDQPAREILKKFAAGDRLAFAAARREVILICAADGQIVQRCIPAGRPELTAITAWLNRHQNLYKALPEAEAADAEAFIRDILETGFSGPREYGLPREDGSVCQAEFWFQRLETAPEEPPCAAVHIRPSVYAILWSRFRPHVYRKNFYLEFDESEFWTNARGCRDEETALPKPEGVYRIVCIGGSTTVEGPYNALTYPNYLERRLREAFNTDRIEVVNCGVDGLDSSAELRNLPFYLGLEPDLVVHYNFANDAAPVFADALRKAESKAGDADTWIGRLARCRVPALILPGLRRMLLPGRGIIGACLEEKVFANHRAIHQTLEKAGVRYAICDYAAPEIPWWKIPARSHLDRIFRGWCIPDYGVYRDLVRTYNRRLRAFCRETGAIHVPAGACIQGGLDTFTDNCHLHVRGIEEKARHAFDTIQKIVAEDRQKYYKPPPTPSTPSARTPAPHRPRIRKKEA
jgi:hypothetical protein